MAVKRVGRQMPTVACVTARAGHQLSLAREAVRVTPRRYQIVTCLVSDCVLLVGQTQDIAVLALGGGGRHGPGGREAGHIPDGSGEPLEAQQATERQLLGQA
jgi:hypothetical protein